MLSAGPNQDQDQDQGEEQCKEQHATKRGREKESPLVLVAAVPAIIAHAGHYNPTRNSSSSSSNNNNDNICSSSSSDNGHSCKKHKTSISPSSPHSTTTTTTTICASTSTSTSTSTSADKLDTEQKQNQNQNHLQVQNKVRVQQHAKKKRTVTPRTNEALYQHAQREYYFDGHLRKVRPYYFEYQIYAKKRWWGLALGEVFQEEFRDRPEEYYAAAIAEGLITVNGEACTLSQPLCNSDLISHRLHRHEPAVSSQPIDILHNDGQLLVVNKPSSLPVHPSGRYRFNTLVEVLQHDLNLTTPLGVVNRLDRLTSGVCMLTVGGAKSQIHKDMANRRFTKEYIARVVGHFPTGVIKCSEPLKLLDHKLGVVVVDTESGKEATTSFELIQHLGGNGENVPEESIIRCFPTTGRTHQIRVHLLTLGFPISNDPLYSHPCWRDAKISTDDILSILMSEQIKSEEEPNAYSKEPRDTPSNSDLEVENYTNSSLKSPGLNASRVLCLDCARTTPLPDPTAEVLCLYLHAHKYSCEEWSYTADPPVWAATKLMHS